MKINFLNDQAVLHAGRLDALYLVDVSCSNATLPLVFDTGGSISMISKSTAASLCAQQTNETVTGGGNAGIIFTADTVVIPQITIGCAVIEGLKAVVADDQALDFGEDDHGNHFCFNGFLGWDVIQHFKWQFDTQNSSFRMAKPEQVQAESNMEDWDTIPIVHAKLNGKDELFGFDSGNTETILGSKLYPLFADAREVADNFVGVDGVKEEVIRKIENFTIQIGKQKITLHDIPAVNREVFPAKNKEVCGLLAADILQGKNWTMDYFNRNLEIQDL